LLHIEKQRISGPTGDVLPSGASDANSTPAASTKKPSDSAGRPKARAQKWAPRWLIRGKPQE